MVINKRKILLDNELLIQPESAAWTKFSVIYTNIYYWLRELQLYTAQPKYRDLYITKDGIRTGVCDVQIEYRAGMPAESKLIDGYANKGWGISEMRRIQSVSLWMYNLG